jgi:LacI family transcriptional regulator
MSDVNLKKLAQELGLSISTVSRALRDSHEIGAATKQRVRELADRLGFEPNPHASSLRKSKSRTIAVILPEIQHTFFSQVINGVEEVAQEKGYHVLIYLTHEDARKEQDIVHLLRNGRVDGMMISVAASSTEFQHFETAQKAGIPMVFFDRTYDEIDVPNIITDNTDIAFEATTHLINNHCKRVAFLSMPQQLSIIQKRKDGYLKALEAHEMTDTENVVECGFDVEENRKKIRALLQSENPPDGIFATAEKLAVITYELCRELNINIPDDLKIISFSNLAVTALFDPPLTTIVQPAFEMGKEAAAILFKIIDQKVLLPNEKKISIPSHIVERRSTGIF